MPAVVNMAEDVKVKTETPEHEINPNNNFGNRQTGKFECFVCGRIFKRKDLLIGHVLTKHADAKHNFAPYLDSFTCDICGKISGTKESCKRHMRTHEMTRSENPTKSLTEEIKMNAIKRAREIGLLNASRELGINHSTICKWRRFLKNPLQCKFCEKLFLQQVHLREHIEENHVETLNKRRLKEKNRKTNEIPESFECIKCFEKFPSEPKLNHHIRTRHNILAERGISSSTLSCEICHSTFKKRKGLAEHIRFVHEKERSFCCEFCTKTFARSAALKTHIADIHEQSGKYFCRFCAKRYFWLKDIEVHERKHTGEKPYKCATCGTGWSSYMAKKSEYKCENCQVDLLQTNPQNVQPKETQEQEEEEERPVSPQDLGDGQNISQKTYIFNTNEINENNDGNMFNEIGDRIDHQIKVEKETKNSEGIVERADQIILHETENILAMKVDIPKEESESDLPKIKSMNFEKQNSEMFDAFEQYVSDITDATILNNHETDQDGNNLVEISNEINHALENYNDTCRILEVSNVGNEIDKRIAESTDQIAKHERENVPDKEVCDNDSKVNDKIITHVETVCVDPVTEECSVYRNQNDIQVEEECSHENKHPSYKLKISDTHLIKVSDLSIELDENNLHVAEDTINIKKDVPKVTDYSRDHSLSLYMLDYKLTSLKKYNKISIVYEEENLEEEIKYEEVNKSNEAQVIDGDRNNKLDVLNIESDTDDDLSDDSLETEPTMEKDEPCGFKSVQDNKNIDSEVSDDPDKVQNMDTDKLKTINIIKLRHECTICHKSYAWRQGMKEHMKLVHMNGKAFECNLDEEFKTEEVNEPNKTQVIGDDENKELDVSNIDNDTDNENEIYEPDVPKSVQDIENIESKKADDSDKVQDMDTDKSKTVNKMKLRHECTICHKTYARRKGMREHIKFVHKKDFKCTNCHKSFLRKNHLLQHVAEVHRKREKLSCKFCTKRFFRNRDLYYHERIHSGERPHQCEICGTSFTRLTTVLQHMKTHTDDFKYPCNDCGKKYRHKGGAKRHFQLAHSNQFLVHSRPFTCSKCEKTFKSERSLKEHAKCYTGIRAFCCLYCDLKFIDNRSLKQHALRSHVDNQPCKLCENKTNDEKHVEDHFNVWKLKRKSKKTTCDICQKKFERLDGYNRHMKSHLKQKDYLCNDCAKCFADKRNLVKHREKFHSKTPISL